jgi:hypothetical protein
MAVTVAGQPTGLLWLIDEPMYLVFSRKDFTFTSLTNVGGDFQLNGVTPAFFSPGGWYGPEGSQIYASPPGQSLTTASGGAAGVILTSNDYYSDAGVGAGYGNDPSLNNRVDVRVKYKMGSGVTEVVTIAGYGGLDGNIYIDVAEGARKYVYDLLNATAAFGSGTFVTYAQIAQIVSIEYIEVLDGSAAYTASPSAYTATGLSVPVLMVPGARRIGSQTFGPQTFAVFGGVAGSYSWALPWGTPIFWNGNVGSTLAYVVCAHWYPTSGAAVNIKYTETYADGTTASFNQSVTQQRATVIAKRVPTNATVVRVSINIDPTGGQSVTARTANVRQCVGEARKRLMVYWQNSVGGLSYALFETGYRERTFKDNADKYSRFAMTASTGGADSFFKTQYWQANRVVVIERTATLTSLNADEALYFSDIIQARRIAVLDERTNEFYTPDFELKLEEVQAYDQSYYTATLTIRYPQYGQL